ncbi:MAG: quinolinate synthase NadA [Syntrophorhabdaceae bacterium]|nr:quinolinate synthase NadA [Syntrophorhabdaceae bacterium]
MGKIHGSGYPERESTLERIKAIRQDIGKDLLIFSHFYQDDDIVELADFVGDSLQLAHIASEKQDAPYIIFCSVSFMAEMAKILCSPKQEVLSPAPKARCPLAEMAHIHDVEVLWKGLLASGEEFIPVVYVNSTAEIKAFCGKNGGTVCTSSNAKKVFEWVFGKGKKLLFFPDENLGRNTSYSLGIRDEEIKTLDPKGDKGLSDLGKVKVLLWKGFCYVHTRFLKTQIEKLKNTHDGLKVIVHPECPPEVCAVSDLFGSTSFIKKTIEEAPSGSKWAVGTEWNFVNRLSKNNPDKTVIPILESRCNEMAQVTPERLLEVLEGIARGELTGRVTVSDEIADGARVGLKRMLEIA